MLDDTHNPADDCVFLAKRNGPLRWPMLVALGVGMVTALLSISLAHSASLFFGNAGSIITALLFPGILGSIAFAGNAHAFSLWIAAGINFIFYFVLVWIICGVSRRILRRFR